VVDCIYINNFIKYALIFQTNKGESNK